MYINTFSEALTRAYVYIIDRTHTICLLRIHLPSFQFFFLTDNPTSITTILKLSYLQKFYFFQYG